MASVNELFNDDKLTDIRLPVVKSKPYGNDKWTDSMIKKHDLVYTTRGVGRPKRLI